MTGAATADALSCDFTRSKAWVDLHLVGHGFFGALADDENLVLEQRRRHGADHGLPGRNLDGPIVGQAARVRCRADAVGQRIRHTGIDRRRAHGEPHQRRQRNVRMEHDGFWRRVRRNGAAERIGRRLRRQRKNRGARDHDRSCDFHRFGLPRLEYQHRQVVDDESTPNGDALGRRLRRHPRMAPGDARDGVGEIFRRLRAGDDDAAAEDEAGQRRRDREPETRYETIEVSAP
jgi:hypothetical protein